MHPMPAHLESKVGILLEKIQQECCKEVHSLTNQNLVLSDNLL